MKTVTAAKETVRRAISRPLPSRPPPGVRTNAAPPVKEAVVDEILPPIDEEADLPVGHEETETQLALVEDGPPSNMFDAPIGKGVGQFDASDIEMPLLKIAQGSDSPLINDSGFSDGDLVLNGEVILFQEGCDPIEFTVLRYQKRFQQQLEYGKSDDFPLLFDTKEQAAEAGLVPFGGHEVGFVPIMDINVLIKLPDGGEQPTCAVEEFDGALYAQAMWQIRGTAYKSVARKVYTQERTRLKDGIHHGGFSITLKKTKGKIGTYWLPILKNGETHSDEFIAFAEQVASGEGEG